MVQGPTWDVDKPDGDTETAAVQCSGPNGNDDYYQPKTGYSKQIGGERHIHEYRPVQAHTGAVCFILERPVAPRVDILMLGRLVEVQGSMQA
jgi:hypothetical protein